MKIAILNDTHCGVRNSSEIFMNYQEEFYRDIFFPYLKFNNITNIFHLGDYYDHRKNINFKALHHNRKIFLEPMTEAGIHMDIIPGNHDVFHKNTNDLTSLKELLGYYASNVSIITKPTKVNGVHLIPWINKENYNTFTDYIAKNDGVLMAHLEMKGFDVLKGFASPHGMDAELFKGYDSVYSGHYHVKSEHGNIRYLGSQMEFTWNDVDDPKHFHVYDTETQTIEAVLNPITIFKRIYYNDEDKDYTNEDVSACTNKFVKVIVDKKTNPFMFDKFIDKIQCVNTHELKIVENFQEFLGNNVETSLEDVENTQELMDNYIDSVTTDLNKDNLKILMNSLYNEALDMEIQ
jgi:DNA repair exonuclease SbcCD nuclease subunit